jgi:ABC-type dipeptide/oligopeptide/nickel transport system permease component
VFVEGVFMMKYIFHRLLLVIPLLLAVSLITFILLQLAPGDPVSAMYGLDIENMNPDQIGRIKEQLGLNDPLPLQYLRYIGNLLQGDMGRSITTKRPIGPDIMQRYPVTLQLTLASMFVVIVIAVPLGVISAVNRGSWIDNLAMLVSLFGVSMPNFWVGIMLILLFSLHLDWLPSVGRGEGFVGTLQSLILPALTLGTSLAGLVTRLTRSSMLEVLDQDYMRTARSKGLKDRTVLMKHGLLNAFIPVITVLGLQLAGLLSGAVIVETVFAWPGMGRLAINAIWRRDYPVIMGTVLLFSVTFVFINLFIDILYVLIDPRIRYD